MTKQKKLSVLIAAETHKKIKRYCVMADISMAQLVEQLLEAFVERQNHDLVNGPTQEPGSSQHP